MQEITSSSIFAYYSILSTSREFIFADVVFFFHFFLLLRVFSLPLYFLSKNGIDPVFSFIMSYCICIENENNFKICMFCKVF